MPNDDLHDFERTSFTSGGKTRAVYRRGSGPAVIVIAEMPGISPHVADFARRLPEIGCTAVMPHLFGDPGKDTGKGLSGIGTIAWGCVSREFATFVTGRTSPVVAWLRALAADEHERCGGPGVGAVGMCFTGGFALAMAVDDRLLAPVLSQPSLPFALSAGHKHSIDISPDDLAVVKHRCAAEGLQVLGLRFKGDKLSPGERFDFLREELGDAFLAVELDDDDANPDGGMSPHSVLTRHLIDEPGQPTRAALDQVLDLFRSKLVSP
ncbi:MAG: dienelactone hydrolase family protein [Actinomycetota bacterium]|nr:dienelactone hydrolase family protein [Actinomycetota bacterium]